MTNPSAKPRIDVSCLNEGKSLGGPLDQSIAEFASSVVKTKTVDPITTEFVRLRCAQIHDCRICGSLRNEEALNEGFDEKMQRKIARYETSDLAPEHIAALRLCDAMILSPELADPSLSDELHRHFSREQIAEICLDVMKWSQQKALVALKLEAPSWKNLNTLSFDDDGNPVIGTPVR